MVLLFHFSLLPVIIQLLFDDALGIHLEFYEEAKSWIEALAHCQRNNSSLVEICNKTVRDEVKNILQNKILQDGVWIGLERPIFGNKDEWKWISGSKLLYAQLNSSDSVNGINNHCGKIIFGNEAKEIKWLDDNCHEKLPYICKEREASNSSCSRQEKGDDDNIGSEEKGDSGEEEEGQGSKEEGNSSSKEKGDSGEEGGHGSKEESDHSKEKDDSSSKEKGDSGEEGGHSSKEESDHSKEKGDSSKEKGTV